MKSCHQRCLASLLLLFIFSKIFSQDQRAYNQNSARSNHGLSISFSPLYSTATKSGSDSLLFRGSGAGLRFGADYFFGNAGISFVSGFGSSSPADATINNFLKHSSIPTDQLLITKTKQQNMYLLLGPSVRFGSKVQLYAHAKGGLFINNSGLISMQQRGSQKILYRNESTNKNIYPGFLTGLKVQYNTKSDAWSFGIGTDYMHTRAEVNNYDARRGGGIEALKLSRNITDLVTGITIQYNIRSPRDAASGQASGKRVLPTVNKREIVSPRDAASGLPTGRRSYQPGQPVYGNITREEATNESCGTVTQRITNSDGSTEEMTFACPDDAANYKIKTDGGMPNRISMNVTVPKQTQGATFGEKVNQGLHAAGGALSQGASLKEGIVHRDLAARNILSGRLSWTSGNTTGIVTNKTVAVSSVGSLAGGSGGGAAAASYAATGRMSNSVPGVVTTIYAREAGSGMATGKRSREAGSGMATGRRQYQPVFAEGQGDVCDPCIAAAKMSGIKNNPLYESKQTAGGDNDCDGVAGMTVSLIEPQSGAVIAKTKTESCGDFFFANVPDGDYVVKISGSFMGKKGYDYYAAKTKTDLLGKFELGDESMQLLINTNNDNDEMTQKAGISTSRSNIRNKSLTIIEADLDGDGEFESMRVLAALNDGTTRDVTAMSRMSTSSTVKKVTVRGWDPEKKQAITGSANAVKEYTISIDGDNGAVLTSQYDNGKKEEAKVTARVSHHPNIVQYIIPLTDTDSDITETNAQVKIGKSRSNIQNNRMMNAEEGDEIWSPRSNIKILRLVPADVDGDGTPEMTVAAPFVPGGSVITAAMRRPGEPIPGIDVKLGKNPGSSAIQSNSSNANGEFEFTNLEAGDYTFTIEQKIVIEDETFISLGGNSTRAQDHNSSRSNKSGIADNDPDNEDVAANAARKGWDGTVKGGSKTKAQDHNSSRSNKTSSVINGGPDDGDATGPVKWMAPESLQKTVNTSRGNIKSMLSSLDELDEQLDGDALSSRYLVNTSRSNIKSQRLAIYDLRETLANMEYMDKDAAINELNRRLAEMNTQFLALQESLKAIGTRYSSVSNVLKTKHDTVKNSISNIR